MERGIYLSAVEALKPAGRLVVLATVDFAAATKTLLPFKIAIRQAAQLVAPALVRLEGKSIPAAIVFYAPRRGHDRGQIDAGGVRGNPAKVGGEKIKIKTSKPATAKEVLSYLPPHLVFHIAIKLAGSGRPAVVVAAFAPRQRNSPAKLTPGNFDASRSGSRGQALGVEFLRH
jgi:hypothetical protein